MTEDHRSQARQALTDSVNALAAEVEQATGLPVDIFQGKNIRTGEANVRLTVNGKTITVDNLRGVVQTLNAFKLAV